MGYTKAAQKRRDKPMLPNHHGYGGNRCGCSKLSWSCSGLREHLWKIWCQVSPAPWPKNVWTILPFVRIQCLKQALEDHTQNIQLFHWVLLQSQQLLLVLIFLAGCCRRGARSCLGKVDSLIFYAVMFLSASSKRCGQALACAVFGSCACIFAKP